MTRKFFLQPYKSFLFKFLNQENTAFLSKPFYYVRDEIFKYFNCHLFPESLAPIEKTGIINIPQGYVIIDLHAGIRDDENINEYTGVLLKFLTLAKPTKKIVFFRMNYSPKTSVTLKKLLHKNNGVLRQCFPWSYYQKSYDFFLKNKALMRRRIATTPKKWGVVFFGREENYYSYPPHAQLSNKFGFPVSLIEAERIFHQKVSLEEWKRTHVLKNRRQFWNELRLDKSKNIFSSSISFSSYIEKISQAKLNFCPPGVGQIIHKVYEDIFIGLPSLLPKGSYDLPFPISLDDVGICYKDYGDFKKKYFDFVKNDRFKEFHNRCISIFEKYLTPEKIAKDIFHKTRKALY